MWGAWVEILEQLGATYAIMSPPVWGAWVEIVKAHGIRKHFPSPPVWGAWVEIRTRYTNFAKSGVAPRVGGVG